VQHQRCRRRPATGCTSCMHVRMPVHPRPGGRYSISRTSILSPRNRGLARHPTRRCFLRRSAPSSRVSTLSGTPLGRSAITPSSRAQAPRCARPMPRPVTLDNGQRCVFDDRPQPAGGVDAVLATGGEPDAVTKIAVITWPVTEPVTCTALPTGNCCAVRGAWGYRNGCQE
jgi:hypothetical protein